MHHGVRIKDSALVAAAVLSKRYITDRFLPDKAIDLVDEAAAKLRTEIDSLPTELDEILRRVMQLEIEREALKKETDPASKERLDKLESELANLKEQADALKAQWQWRKTRSSACGPSVSRSSRPRSRSSRLSANTTSTAPRSCAMADWPGSNASSKRKRSN